MRNKKIDLSIIIVSYNTRKLLKDCLESIVPVKNKINLEVIVVDNASNDASVEMVKDLSDKLDLEIIVNKKNRGFGAANNQGMEKAKGEVFLLLNSDTLVNETTILETVSFMKSDHQVGVLGCKLVGENGKVQSNGGYFPNFINVFFWMTFLDDIKFLYKIIKPYHINPTFEKETTKEQDWVTGAYFMLKKKVYEQLGEFDKDYFMYVEEMDYCYRIKSKGWKVIYNPEYEITHFGGASGTSEGALINEFKGLLTFYNKHKNGTVIIKMLLKLGSILRIIVFYLLGKRKLSNIYVKAYNSI